MIDRDQMLGLLKGLDRREVEIPGLGLVAIRPLRLSEILAIWDRAPDDAGRQLELISAATVGEAGASLATPEEWDLILGARPDLWSVLGSAVNRAQGFSAEETQGN